MNSEYVFITFCGLLFIALFCMVYNVNILSNNFDISNLYNSINKKEGFKVKNDFSNKYKKKQLKTIKKKESEPYDTNIDYSLYGTEKFYDQFNTKNNKFNNIRNKSKDQDSILKDKLKKNNEQKYHKRGKKSKMDTKLEKFKNTPRIHNSKHKDNKYKNDKYNNDNNNDDNNSNDEYTLSLLKQIASDENPGSTDNFQNVLDELDNIDVDTFSLKNITGVVSNYNDNITNRLKHAGKKGYSNFDKSIAKGSVLLDEFKKLISYTSLT